MAADEYFIESLIRDRLAEALTRAGFAALCRQSQGGSADAKGSGAGSSSAADRL
jgi:hypothetical protein